MYAITDMRKDSEVLSWNPAWARGGGPTSVSPACWPRGWAAQTGGLLTAGARNGLRAAATGHTAGREY